MQGEGYLAGCPTYFVRFGGCDYQHCSWCDSLFAVIPAEVRAHSEKLTDAQIVGRLLALPPGPEWVTFSGGNPALHDLSVFMEALHNLGYKVAVETQGSRWKDWLYDVDSLVVSPKAPSSGMVSDRHNAETAAFMEQAEVRPGVSLKIVVFDDADLGWAREFLHRYPEWPAYLSVGTDQPAAELAHLTVTHKATLDKISSRYRWLCEQVAVMPDLKHVRVLPQLHVLAWGHAKGV